VPGEPAHRALFSQKPLPVLLKLGGQHLDRHHPIQGYLGAPIYNAETPAADLFGIIEPGRTQLHSNRQTGVMLRRKRPAIHHLAPCDIAEHNLAARVPIAAADAWHTPGGETLCSPRSRVGANRLGGQ